MKLVALSLSVGADGMGGMGWGGGGGRLYSDCRVRRFCQLNNNNINDFISRALFHVIHAQLR